MIQNKKKINKIQKRTYILLKFSVQYINLKRGVEA